MREAHRNAAAALARSYHQLSITTSLDQRVFRAMLRRDTYQTIWRAKNIYPNVRRSSRKGV